MLLVSLVIIAHDRIIHLWTPELGTLGFAIARFVGVLVVVFWVAVLPTGALVAARRWNGSPVTALLVALGGLILWGPALVFGFSFMNDCATGESYPFPWSECR